MKKCDFCEKSLPNGKCWWSGINRVNDCEKAIKRMMEVLKNCNNRK